MKILRDAYFHAVLGGITLVLCGLTGCKSDSAADLCAGKYERTFEEAARAWKPWEVGRRIAQQSSIRSAVQDELLISSVPDTERQTWEEWARRNLVDIQHVLDDLDALPRRNGAEEALRVDALRAELSGAADELVQIHGLIHQGRADRVASALSRLQKRAERARGLACSRD